MSFLQGAISYNSRKIAEQKEEEKKANEQALIDKLNEEIASIASGEQVSPEAQKEASTEAEIKNWDAIHSAPDTSSRRFLGKQVEASAAEQVKPDYGKKQLLLSQKLSPFMVKAGVERVPVLDALKDRASAQEKEALLEKKGDSGGGFSGWKARSKDWDVISEMPDGPEKETAKQNYLYKWSPSVGYNAAPESIKQAEKKAVAVSKATVPVKAETQYATTTAAEQAQRDIQKTNPMLTGEGSIKIAQSAMAIKNLNRLKEELEKGNIDYFDIIKKTGQFKNPKVNNAFQQVSEIVGRQQSGAAIANHEWSNFGKEVLNRNFLLTEQGRKTALENIDDYLDRFHSVGILQTSDEDWYNKQSERVKAARERSSPSSVQTKVINGTTYKKVPGGWEPQ